jgi:hypothetical protein
MDSLVKKKVLAGINKLLGWALLPRYFLRIAKYLIIFLGISLSVVAALEWAHKDLALSSVGLLIALLAAFNTLFSWDQTWATNHNTTALVKAQHGPDPDKHIELPMKRTPGWRK